MREQTRTRKRSAASRLISTPPCRAVSKALTQTRSAIDIAWMHILTDSVDRNILQRLRTLFPAEPWVESQGFNLVHKTVLGLNPLKLDDLLVSVPTPIIDSSDDYGRTPLWWTARRGDYPAMMSLLRYNVNVCKPSNSGWSALSSAMWSKSQQCVRLLLRQSPDVNLNDSRGWLALHHAAFFGLDPDIIKATIPPKIGINATSVDSHQCTALMLAAQENHHHTCEYLLSLGADPNVADALGETPLHYALQSNAHSSIQLLMVVTDIKLKTKAEETYLHHAALHSDIRSLEILDTFDLRGIDTQAAVTSKSPAQMITNVAGLTALEIAEQRTAVATEWLAMFRRLLIKAEPSDDHMHTDAMHELPDEYHDALEIQE